MSKKLYSLFTLLTITAFLLAACAGNGGPAADEPAEEPAAEEVAEEVAEEPAAEEPAAEEPCLIVGAIYVGPITDFGFNQAQHEGLVAMQEKMTCQVELLEAENVFESAQAESTIETMIQQGARLIFATSFGHLDAAFASAENHPEVTYMHAGGFLLADNFGTYFTTMPDHLYFAGIAAGKMTETNKIGYIAAFPIGFTLANINAFTLGAQSVNPDIETHVVFNFSWVDSAKEAAATNALVAEGVDVVAMHVDSPVTIIQTAEEAGIFSIGFHTNASQEFAPEGWITGLGFNWEPIMTETVQQVLDGTFVGQHVRRGIEVGWMILAPFGSAVPQDVQDLVLGAVDDYISGDLIPFTGPLVDQDGVERLAAGETIPNESVGDFDWFVQGVIGEPPQ